MNNLDPRSRHPKETHNDRPGIWLAQGAYIYTLMLDPLSLAWEYLRRNPEYKSEYRQAVTMREGGTPDRWGLQSWEDPKLDSREVDPVWQRDQTFHDAAL